MSWRLALVYGSPYRQYHPQVWDTLESVLSSTVGPLICIGDFNQVLSPSDRLSTTPSTLPSSASFSTFLFNLGLSELPNNGPHFTWTNNCQGHYCTFELLDWAFFNGEWPALGLDTSVTNLPIHSSDHSPFLLYTSLPGTIRRPQFKFEQFWTSYEQCKSIVRQSWSGTFKGPPSTRLLSVCT